MILLVDIGNSNIVFGNYDNEISNVFRINTRKDYTSYEYGLLLNQNLNRFEYEDVIISSVVPKVTEVLKQYFIEQFNINPVVVGPGLKTGLNIKTDNPKEVGADLIVGAVASFNYGNKVVIVDLGTASKLVLVEDKKLKGVVIAPGVKTSLESMIKKTSLLPEIDLVVPKNKFGTNTIECIQSGIIMGHVYMIEGFINSLKNQDYTIVITGGFGRLIGEELNIDCIINDNLLLEGLVDIYNKNK